MQAKPGARRKKDLVRGEHQLAAADEFRASRGAESCSSARVEKNPGAAAESMQANRKPVRRAPRTGS